jgi:hypothetical protein
MKLSWNYPRLFTNDLHVVAILASGNNIACLYHKLFLLIRQKYYLRVKQYSVIVTIVIIRTVYRLSSASAGAESAGLVLLLVGHLSRA